MHLLSFPTIVLVASPQPADVLIIDSLRKGKCHGLEADFWHSTWLCDQLAGERRDATKFDARNLAILSEHHLKVQHTMKSIKFALRQSGAFFSLARYSTKHAV